MTAREDRLESWKEISAHLERTTRTCQRWESEYGLPVHRFDESSRARVYAFKGELDDWFERTLGETETRDSGAGKRRRKWLAAAEAAGSLGKNPHSVAAPPPDPPEVSRSAIANKAYQAGRNAMERFLTIRSAADLFTAVEMFKKVREEDSVCPYAYLGLGDAYRWEYSFLGMKSDRLDLMTRNYARAYELAPGLAETDIGLGWNRYFAGDKAGACESFNRAAEINPGNPDVDLAIANFLIGLGHPDRAARRLTMVVSRSPSLSRVRWLRALCYEWMGDYEAALADGKKALELEPTSSYLRCMQARLMILSGDLQGAETELSLADTLCQGAGDVEFTRALLWAARGDREKAEDALSRPARTTALRNYIETMAHAALGDVDETLDLIVSMIETGFRKLVSYPYFYLYLANPNNHFYDPLRRDPRFLEIVARQKARHEEESARLGSL
jgi:Flp pilus assembly protein TadD